ncbi:MAG: hypothetical protein F4053_00595 [Proteobacteria bacterium]|nr:hypothetical protein [Pseudomonadota bacterium]MYJ94133.1 hypothetical protein [Pseudomonadota bacterium]
MKVKNKFGYRLHLIADIWNEIPVAFGATMAPASTTLSRTIRELFAKDRCPAAAYNLHCDGRAICHKQAGCKSGRYGRVVRFYLDKVDRHVFTPTPHADRGGGADKSAAPRCSGSTRAWTMTSVSSAIKSAAARR